MPNNSASSIRTALNTHLTAVTQLKQVKIGRDANTSSGFPFCRFYLVAVESNAVDNAPSDYRTYRFQIDIMQEITNKSKQDSEADFEDAVDAVLDKLNTKWRIPDGSDIPTVDNTVIQTSPIREVEISTGPALVLSITLDCKTLIY